MANLLDAAAVGRPALLCVSFFGGGVLCSILDFIGRLDFRFKCILPGASRPKSRMKCVLVRTGSLVFWGFFNLADKSTS